MAQNYPYQAGALEQGIKLALKDLERGDPERAKQQLEDALRVAEKGPSPDSGFIRRSAGE